MPSTIISGIDLFDLSRGEGEWRNLQDVVRKALRISFENAQRQQETIEKLEANISMLQRELGEKASLADVKTVVDSKLCAQPKPATAEEVTALRIQVGNVTSEVERKASVRYVDESLKRKMNKSDATVFRKHAEVASVPVDTCMQDILAIKTKMLSLERSIQGLNVQIENYSTKSEVSALAGSVQDVCDIASGKADRSEVQSLLSLKVRNADNWSNIMSYLSFSVGNKRC